MNSPSTDSTRSNDSRVETLATRITAAEMRTIKAAARDSGSSSSEWLRKAALEYLRQTGRKSTTPIEVTILEELTALKFLLVNLFAGANLGVALQTIYQMMATADSVKQKEAEIVRRSCEAQSV